MNGKLNKYTVARKLAELSDQVRNGIYGNTRGSDVYAEDIKTLLVAVADDFIRTANVDVTSVAHEVIERVGIDVRYKIECIKQIRSKSGSGLREAKEAYEAALPTPIERRIVTLRVQLENARDAAARNTNH